MSVKRFFLLLSKEPVKANTQSIKESWMLSPYTFYSNFSIIYFIIIFL